MQEIIEAPQVTAAGKSKSYADQLNRFPTFKNKMEYYHLLPVKTTPAVPPIEAAPATPTTPDEPAKI